MTSTLVIGKYIFDFPLNPVCTHNQFYYPLIWARSMVNVNRSDDLTAKFSGFDSHEKFQK